MEFLTSENDFKLEKHTLLIFYSSELVGPVAELLMSSIQEVSKKIKTICIDILYFDNLIKRFAITEIPTILLIKNAKEKQRFLMNLTKKEIDIIITEIT